MATIVCGLPAALLKGDKLVAQIDEGHRVTLAAQFEPEETAIECQCLIDIPYLQCDVVEAYDARSFEFHHQNLLCLRIRWVRPAHRAIAITTMWAQRDSASFDFEQQMKPSHRGVKSSKCRGQPTVKTITPSHRVNTSRLARR